MKIKNWLIIFLGMLIISACAVGLFWPRQADLAPVKLTGLDLGSPGSFSRAELPRVFTFPADFGAHPDFQTEWWYYTGNLKTEDGRWFGYQLTFFRRALQPAGELQPRLSSLAVNQVYMAHLTLTDVNSNTFQFFEKLSRASDGLAGAVGVPLYQVWLESWRVDQRDSTTYHLTAAADGFSLDLNLRDMKGPLLQGDQGLSRKGPQAGEASYYFSQTHLETNGVIRIGNNDFSVSGLSWMDHEFSTSVLSDGIVGWDWFAVQLGDGTELMLYTLRRADGKLDEFSSGSWIQADGSRRSLARSDFNVTSTGTWKSPHTGATYPAGWNISIDTLGVRLKVMPRIPDQELQVSFTYWEGAVAVTGESHGKGVTGGGYVELTGYAGSMEGRF